MSAQISSKLGCGEEPTPVLLVVNEARLTGGPISGLEDLRALKEAGFDVSVQLVEGGPLLERFSSEAGGCELLTRSHTKDILRRLRWRGLKVGIEAELRDVDVRLARTPAPRLVVCETLATAGTAVAAARRNIPTMLVVREPEVLIRRFWRAYPLQPLVDRIRFVANSRATRDVLDQFVGGDPAPILHPPVDVAELLAYRREPREDPSVVHLVGVGRVSRVKGVDLFIDCVARVESGGRRVSATWIGGGDLAWARRQARRKGVGRQVMFTGPQVDPYHTMARADALLVTSRAEPFSRVSIEGLALGVPVIAFEVGGISEAVGDAGTLVPPESVADMANAVLALDEATALDAQVRGPIWAQRFAAEEYRVRFRQVIPP